MNWEEAVRELRSEPGSRALVEASYLREDLAANVESFRVSDEFRLTREMIGPYVPPGGRILDVGSGNGFAAVTFALEGFEVEAAEPDGSETVGAGAIRTLATHYGLSNLEVHEESAESLAIPSGRFDVVYARQALHHADDLHLFVENCARLLKPGGLFMAVRDHVILDEADLQLFLEQHPLHPRYGGENAFRDDQYRAALGGAGLRVTRVLRHYESPLNYFPLTRDQLLDQERRGLRARREALRRRIGPLAAIPGLIGLFSGYLDRRLGPVLDEETVPGRLYTYLAVKPCAS